MMGNARFIIVVCFIMLTNVGVAQKRPIETSIGIYFSGDAAMEYTGTSFLLSQDIPVIGNKISLIPYAQYFYAVFDNTSDSFTSSLLALMVQKSNYSAKGRGIYYAIGAAFQHRREFAYGAEEKDNAILPTFRFGYRFLAKKIKLQAEITTPAFYKTTKGSFELFTLPSIGIRANK